MENYQNPNKLSINLQVNKAQTIKKDTIYGLEDPKRKEKEDRLEAIISHLKFQKEEIDDNELNKIFERLDTNGDKDISNSELKTFLEALKTSVNNFDSYIDNIYKDFKKNNEGNISQAEFVETMKKKINNSNNGDLSELLEIYKLFDANHDHKICQQDLYNVMMALGESFNEKQCAEIISCLATNDKKHLDFNDFYNIIKDYNNKDVLD